MSTWAPTHKLEQQFSKFSQDSLMRPTENAAYRLFADLGL